MSIDLLAALIGIRQRRDSRRRLAERRRHCRRGLGGGRRDLAPYHLVHERDVRDGEPQGLDARQPLLVRERRHFPAQLVERLVQIEHAPPLPDVGRSSLRHRRHPLAFLRPRRRRARAAPVKRPAVLSVNERFLY